MESYCYRPSFSSFSFYVVAPIVRDKAPSVLGIYTQEPKNNSQVLVHDVMVLRCLWTRLGRTSFLSTETI